MHKHRLQTRPEWRKAVDTDKLKFQLLRVLVAEAPMQCEKCAVRLTALLSSGNYSALYDYCTLADEHVLSSSATYWWHAQVTALVKKHIGKTSPREFTPEHTAWVKFQESESRCASVNEGFRSGLIFCGTLDLLSEMRRSIRKLLGDEPSIERILKGCGWGPGASIGTNGDATCWGRKISTSRITSTAGCYFLARDALHLNDEYSLLFRKGLPISIGSQCEFVDYNMLTFVPKTAKTHRSIAVEPLLNAYVQKGVDNELRRKLKQRWRHDLTDQYGNQEAARLGSISGLTATIDLSSASDSISYELVKYLVPRKWFEVLDRARSPCYLYKGAKARYEKYGSMGNGIVFPLQTLIFSAACRAVGCSEPYVYGDDIIVGVEFARPLLALLANIGFQANTDKTFIEGPFRESCGADWYMGQPVRAAYFDCETRQGNLNSIIAFHNTARVLGYSEDFLHTIRLASGSAQRLLKPFAESGDGAFCVEVDVAASSPYVTWDRKRWAWTWSELVQTGVRDHLSHLPLWLKDELEYQAVLKGSPSSLPFAYRRKTKVRLRRKTGWPLPVR